VSKIKPGGLCSGFEGLDACWNGLCVGSRCQAGQFQQTAQQQVPPPAAALQPAAQPAAQPARQLQPPPAQPQQQQSRQPGALGQRTPGTQVCHSTRFCHCDTKLLSCSSEDNSRKSRGLPRGQHKQTASTTTLAVRLGRLLRSVRPIPPSWHAIAVALASSALLPLLEVIASSYHYQYMINSPSLSQVVPTVTSPALTIAPRESAHDVASGWRRTVARAAGGATSASSSSVPPWPE